MDKINRPVIPAGISPKAEWFQTSIGTLPLFECPACGCYVYKKTNYCPSCGRQLIHEEAEHEPS